MVTAYQNLLLIQAVRMTVFSGFFFLHNCLLRQTIGIKTMRAAPLWFCSLWFDDGASFSSVPLGLSIVALILPCVLLVAGTDCYFCCGWAAGALGGDTELQGAVWVTQATIYTVVCMSYSSSQMSSTWGAGGGWAAGSHGRRQPGQYMAVITMSIQAILPLSSENLG